MTTRTKHYHVLIKIEEYMKELLSNMIFELNDAYNREQIRNKMYDFLMGLKTRGEIWSFKVTCDMSNNTIDDIDNNRFNLVVAVEPEKGAGFYKIPGSIRCFQKGYYWFPPEGVNSAKKRSRKVRRRSCHS